MIFNTRNNRNPKFAEISLRLTSFLRLEEHSAIIPAPTNARNNGTKILAIVLYARLNGRV